VEELAHAFTCSVCGTSGFRCECLLISKILLLVVPQVCFQALPYINYKQQKAGWGLGMRLVVLTRNRTSNFVCSFVFQILMLQGDSTASFTMATEGITSQMLVAHCFTWSLCPLVSVVKDAMESVYSAITMENACSFLHWWKIEDIKCLLSSWDCCARHLWDVGCLALNGEVLWAVSASPALPGVG